MGETSGDLRVGKAQLLWRTSRAFDKRSNYKCSLSRLAKLFKATGRVASKSRNAPKEREKGSPRCQIMGRAVNRESIAENSATRRKFMIHGLHIHFTIRATS